MTQEEWLFLADVVEGAWPGEFGDLDRGAYFYALEGYEATDVRTALDGMLSSSTEHRPSAPMFVTAVQAIVVRRQHRDEPLARPAGHNAPRLIIGMRTTRVQRGIHEDCGGTLLEQEATWPHGNGPIIVQCERCLEIFGMRRFAERADGETEAF